MVGLLCLLCIGIFGISSNSRIPLQCAKRVMDPEAFQRYPWGRVGFTSLLESIKVLTYERKKSYTLHGCVHVLSIWIFESVPGLGEKFGNRIEGADVPLLSWLGSRPHTIDVGTSTKRKKDKAHVDGCHASDMVVAHNIAILGLVESVKNLSAKIDGIDVNVADKVSEKLDATIQAKVDAKVGLYEKEMMEKIAMLVEDIKNRKEKAYVNIHTDVANSNDHNSIAQEEDDDSSNALHLAAAMLMFHRRSMQSSSPYASRRIAFLDRWFVKSWVNDFEKQDKNSIELSDMYSKAFNGEYPEQFVTGKKWFKDVDSLFLCHNINGNHWVALHIDLLRSTIYVYDCIPDVVKAHKDLQEECRPFTKMIPLILNKMLPPTKGKKSEQQFALRRPKNVPRNDDPGDCGVYSLKYIECLAIGCTFHGLSDEIIPAQRMKLAAEIYEEVAEVDAEGSI
ncbi:hypothetical protein Bca101_092433 [Brassica carinata]